MRSKILGLAVFAFGLLAFASVAQAGELKGDWELRNEKGELVLLAATETIDGKIDQEGTLLVLELSVEIKCSGLTVNEGTILPLASGRSFGHGKVLFTGCWLWSDTAKSLVKLCLVHEDTNLPKLSEEEGKIQAEALFHVVRTAANGTAYVLAEPSSGLSGKFANMKFPETCPTLPNELVSVTGGVVFEFTTLEAVEQLAKVAPESVQLLFGHKLKFGIREAHLTATAWLLETGLHKGLKWGIEAGA